MNLKCTICGRNKLSPRHAIVEFLNQLSIWCSNLAWYFDYPINKEEKELIGYDDPL